MAGFKVLHPFLKKKFPHVIVVFLVSIDSVGYDNDADSHNPAFSRLT